MPTPTRVPSPFWFRFAAVGKSPSAHHGFIRGAIALHTPTNSGQHRSPVCGLIARPCPYAYEQEHEELQGTAHAVWYDPLFTQPPVVSRREQPYPGPFCFLQFGPAQSVPNYYAWPRWLRIVIRTRRSGHTNPHTPERFPLPGKSSGPGFVVGLPTSLHATSKTPAVEKQASLQQDA